MVNALMCIRRKHQINVYSKISILSPISDDVRACGGLYFQGVKYHYHDNVHGGAVTSRIQSTG
jgi:hypothetical protein